MRKEEILIGDYTINGQVPSQTRASMLNLIEKLGEIKEYSIDTFFLAVSLLDRYLANVATKERVSCLGSLAVTCLLIAVKLEEPVTPSYNNMCKLLAKLKVVKIVKSTICQYEIKVLSALDFSVRYAGSLNFLDRFLRLYGLDKGEEKSPQTQIMALSYKLCLMMQRDAKFLVYLPSQLAAASLMVAINLTHEKKAERGNLSFRYVSA